MKIQHLLLLICTGLVLTACEKQAPEQTATASPPAAPTTTTPAPATVSTASAEAPAVATTAPSAEAPAVATNAPSAAADGPTRYIDHSKDEAEFKLKKSLAGLESMLETVSDPEQVATMKKDMAELQSQLDALQKIN